jgi:hypothetical protein
MTATDPPAPLAAKPVSRSPSSSQQFSSVRNVLAIKSSGSGTIDNAALGLDILQTVMEAVNTLPFIKYIASVSIEILKLVSVGHNKSLMKVDKV